jgi:predicted nucleotidyltransferase
MRFADLADATMTDHGLKKEINALLKVKMSSGESQYGAPFPNIQAFIEEFFARQDIPEAYRQITSPENDAALNQLLYQAVMQFTPA